MTETVPSSSSPAAMPITEPNSNDVLLGRGPNFTNYEGNLRFHKLVNENKFQYNSTASRDEKNRIAREVLALVHAAGGRFLKQEDPKDPYNENWVEVKRSVSEEKIKQALREKQYYTTAPGTRTGVTRKREDDDGASLPTNVPSSGPGFESLFSQADGVPAATVDTFSALSNVALPSWLSAQEAGPSIVDPRLLLFQDNYFALNQQGLDPRALPLMNPGLRSQLANSVLMANPDTAAHVRLLLLQQLYSQPDIDATAFQPQFSPMNLVMNAASTVTESSCSQEEEGESRSLRDLHLSDDDGTKVDDEQAIDWDLNDMKTLFSDTGGDESAEDESAQLTEDELAAFLLSTLAVTGRKVITEEEEAKERESLTNEEKAKLLVDAFGKTCQEEAPQKKRAKRDLDPSSIDFLIRQMKCEIERIPAHEKNALLEARAKCSSDEFSDARLEKFLRCEGMNAQMAAQRFVIYWNSRHEVFGSEKFTLPMTLSGALRDDIKALQTGVCRLLPKPDASGRPIIVFTPTLNTREGYDSDSMIRADWYLKEVLARENTHRQSGFVTVTWGDGLTIWDYDRAWDRLAEYVSTAHPLKMLVSHLCCMPGVITKVVSPIVHSLMDKEARTRLLVHDASASETLQALSPYGIGRDMLPLEMGGSIEFDQVEWLENRRAAEMEEIE